MSIDDTEDEGSLGCGIHFLSCLVRAVVFRCIFIWCCGLQRAPLFGIYWGFG